MRMWLGAIDSKQRMRILLVTIHSKQRIYMSLVTIDSKQRIRMLLAQVAPVVCACVACGLFERFAKSALTSFSLLEV